MNSKGLTVIEMLVALGIFSVLLVTVTGAFGNGYASQRKVLEMQAVQRDGAYLLEIMSREIRMASKPDGMVPGESGSSLSFVNHDGKNVTYCRSNAKPECSNSGAFFSMINNDTGMKSVMNSSSVEITKLQFYPSKTDNRKDYSKAEPMVTISMTLRSTRDDSIQMTLQTSVAMRLYYDY